MIPALVTAAAPYVIPAACYVVGHIVGWFHHKLTHKNKPDNSPGTPSSTPGIFIK